MKYTKIKSDTQYNFYCERHETLTFKDYTAHLEEIELIEILIDEYENRTLKFESSMSPIEVLEYLLQENNLTKSAFAKE